jgi:hypothetical protein
MAWYARTSLKFRASQSSPPKKRRTSRFTYGLPHLLNRRSERLAVAPQRIMQWATVTGKDEKNNPLPGNRETEIISYLKLSCSFKLAPDMKVTDVNCRSCTRLNSCILCCMYVACCNRSSTVRVACCMINQQQAEPMACRATASPTHGHRKLAHTTLLAVIGSRTRAAAW